ncbi:MAG: hypothetical protein ORN50_02495, partial [Crocinitomicaceae bacterium]|nr:hypothetical protein [Crocinitomicaceae bacterium]
FAKEVEDVAGLYPFNDASLDWFGESFLKNIHHVDLMPAWNRVIPDFESFIFQQHCPKTYITKLQHLEPYFFDAPWTNYLEDKTVLVVSPFADSINHNFSKLQQIWNNKITPNFKLKTIKYPTSITITENANYSTSTEIYNKFADAIHNTDFDIGIFGTGHTGLLFAIECKKMGKSGIHLGGPTQILFGIKGNRWEENKDFQPFFNEHWTKPLTHETPKRIDKVEGACYW